MKTSVGIVLALFLIGCSSGGKKVSVAFRNIGEKSVFIFPIEMNHQTVGAGTLISNATASSTIYLETDFEFPEDVTVKWRKSDDSVVTKTVPLKGKFPKEYKQNRDELIFNIFADDTVQLSFKIETGKYKWKEIDSEGNEITK